MRAPGVGAVDAGDGGGEGALQRPGQHRLRALPVRAGGVQLQVPRYARLLSLLALLRQGVENLSLLVTSQNSSAPLHQLQPQI